MSARAIMVLGTASHVGKSLIVAGICRMLAADGYRVAPFKAQNMSLNSSATLDGFEIGRAQAMQAEAAGIAATVDMNPILLKPTSQSGSQVVLLGKVRGVEQAADYHHRRVETYFPLVCEAYQRLAEAYDIVVLEGAGSPAEINLKATDIVNMRMAIAADANCLLVGDIDRGGVFASLLGTVELLEAQERHRIKAFAINKFRGSLALLSPGVDQISQRIGIPSAGVIPWLPEVGLDEEDSVAQDDLPRIAMAWKNPLRSKNRPLRTAVLAIPRISNATDFAALFAEPEVDCAYADHVRDLAHADVVIIPGTKTTLDALRWLFEHQFVDALQKFRHRGLLVGICGGYQILGNHVSDPYNVEGGGSSIGLGILAITTVLEKHKTTQRVSLTVPRGTMNNSDDLAGQGYEIHMGVSQRSADVQPFCHLRRANGEQLADGAITTDGACLGTYVHGFFQNDILRHAFLAYARTRADLAPAQQQNLYEANREAKFNRLAAHLRSHLDLRLLLP